VLLFWILFQPVCVGTAGARPGVLESPTSSRRPFTASALPGPPVGSRWQAVLPCSVFFWHGRAKALQFVTGYVIELSLSVDNCCVSDHLPLFSKFRPIQHQVLFRGISRGACSCGVHSSLAGVGLIRRFTWITYRLRRSARFFRNQAATAGRDGNPSLKRILFCDLFPPNFPG